MGLTPLTAVKVAADFAAGDTSWLLPNGTTEADALRLAKIVGARVEVPAVGRLKLVKA